VVISSDQLSGRAGSKMMKVHILSGP